MMKLIGPIIGVIGGEQASEQALAQAETVGIELARRGCVLICGGSGGVMEAACRGAQPRAGSRSASYPAPTAVR